jgi:predicted nucleic acid-binding protein
MLVDACVALKWYLAEEDSDAADKLYLDEQLLAPDLILAEVGNALWKAWRKEALDASLIPMAMTNLEQRLVQLYPPAPLIGRATEIACALAHPVYDCLYLACAEREGVKLITADLKLLRAVDGTEWAGLCRTL